MQLNVLELKWSKNEIVLTKTTRKYIQILFNYHFEKMGHSIGKSTRQYGVQKYFFIRKFNEIGLYEIIT